MEDNRTIGELVETAVEVLPSGRTNIVLDATVLTTLMSCPRLTDFRFNMNLQGIGGKSNSLECGSIVHKYLEVKYRLQSQGMRYMEAHGFGMMAAELYISGCPHCTDFVASDDISKPECGHEPNDYPGVQNTPKESEGYVTGWQWVLDTLEEYNKHYINDHWVTIETEVVKGKVLYEDDEIRVLWKAKLDWIVDTNQGIFPVDHKTMKQNRDTVSLNNQFMGQCLMVGSRSMFVNKIGFQKSLKPAERFHRTMVNYSTPRLMEWQSEILPYYAKLLVMYAETGYFPPNFNNCESKYGNCNFKSVCESDPAMREDEIKRLFIVGPVWNPTNPEKE